MTETKRKVVEQLAEHPAYGKRHSNQRRDSKPARARRRHPSPSARLWINGEELAPDSRFAHLDHVYD